VRRVVIDESQLNMNGYRAYELRQVILAKLRCLASQSGKVMVVIGPKDFGFMADIHDSIHESGRYSQASAAQVPRGEWLAPTDVMKLTGTADVSYDNRQINVGGRVINGNVNASYRKARASVKLVLEPIELRTGAYAPGYQATGVVTKTLDFNVNGYGNGSGGGSNSNQCNQEDGMLLEAAEQALADIANQLDMPGYQTAAPAVMPSTQPAPTAPLGYAAGRVTFAFPSWRAFVIDLNQGKVVHTDDRIKYTRPGKADALAQFRVTAIAGQTVLLEKEYGDQPEPTDGFRIICTH
jgi:hypothetical protein